MNKIIVSALALLITISVNAQGQYEISFDKGGQKVLKGIISRDLVEKDTAFKWYASNASGYTANSVALNALKQYGDSIQIVAFMGTWCEDSHSIIPKFFNLLDAAGYPKNKLTLIGVDRSKKTLGNLSEALDVKNVPTLMVMKNGKEIGRVVEYGKYGMWDKEFGEVIQSGFSK